LTVLLLGVLDSSARAEIISDFKAQAGTPVEITPAPESFRSIYLGRLFQGQTISNPVQSIAAFGSINLAPGSAASPHLFLWAGKASAVNPGSFNNASSKINTGLGFWTTLPNGVEAHYRTNSSVDFSLGTNLQTLVNSSSATGVDFWFVSATSTTNFDAPAGSSSPQTNTFGVQLTAVPEPSSIGLVLGAATVGGIYRRWRKKQNAVLN
jgi:hypothetical protein